MDNSCCRPWNVFFPTLLLPPILSYLSHLPCRRVCMCVCFYYYRAQRELEKSASTTLFYLETSLSLCVCFPSVHKNKRLQQRRERETDFLLHYILFLSAIKYHN